MSKNLTQALALYVVHQKIWTDSPFYSFAERLIKISPLVPSLAINTSVIGILYIVTKLFDLDEPQRRKKIKKSA